MTTISGALTREISCVDMRNVIFLSYKFACTKHCAKVENKLGFDGSQGVCSSQSHTTNLRTL